MTLISQAKCTHSERNLIERWPFWVTRVPVRVFWHFFSKIEHCVTLITPESPKMSTDDPSLTLLNEYWGPLTYPKFEYWSLETRPLYITLGIYVLIYLSVVLLHDGCVAETSLLVGRVGIRIFFGFPVFLRPACPNDALLVTDWNKNNWTSTHTNPHHNRWTKGLPQFLRTTKYSSPWI